MQLSNPRVYTLLMKIFTGLLLALVLFMPTLTNAQTNVAQGGTGTTTVPTGWFLTGSTALRLTAKQFISLVSDITGILGIVHGGTGVGTFTAGIVAGSGTNPLFTVPTTTASCSGSTSCSSFTVIGSSPITISSTGGSGGSGTVSTSSSETSGQLPYWTSTSGTPALLSGGNSNFTYDSVTGLESVGALNVSSSTVPANGVYLNTTNQVSISAGGSGTRLTIGAAFVQFATNLIGSNGAGPALVPTAASSTNPTVIPNRSALGTGFGAQAAGNISAIIGNVEAIRWANPAASVAGESIFPAPFAAGTATTNFPLFYFNTASTTAVTSLSTAGTYIGVNAASTFTGNFLDFHVNGGTNRFFVASDGSMTTVANITAGGNIAATTGSITAGTSVGAGSSNSFNWSARSKMFSPADGTIEFQNQAQTDFSRLQLGGTTSAFPSIKRNGTGIDFRLADDSGYATTTMLGLRLSGLTNAILSTDALGNVVATTTGGSGVTSVTGTYPIISSGGTTPAISLAFGTTTLINAGTGIATSSGANGAITVTNSSPLSGLTTSYPLSFTGGNTLAWIGLATTSQPASSNILVSNGTNGIYGAATSTLTASSPLTGSFTQIGSGGTLGCQTASGSQAGCLSSTDWTTFNGKQSALTFSTGLTNTAGTITVNTSQNISTLSNLTVAGFVQTTSGGVLSSAALTSGQVTTALGFTPFGGTNPLPIANGGTATTTGGVTNGVEYYNGTTLTNGANFNYNGTQVGIGTSTASAKLDVGNGVIRAVTGSNTLPTSGSGLELITASGQSFLTAYDRTNSQYIPLQISSSNTTFSNGYVAIGTSTPKGSQVMIASSTAQQLTLTDASLTNNQWSFRNAGGTLYLGTTSPSTYATSTVSAVSITSQTSTQLGIGTTTPWRTLSVTGTVGFDGLTAAAGTVVGVCFNSLTKELEINTITNCTVSSRRYKHDIAYLDPETNGLSEILQLKPASFTYNGNNFTEDGFIAEDVASTTHPELAGYDKQGLPSAVDDIGIDAQIVLAIQQQQAEIKAITAGIPKDAEDNWQWLAIVLLAAGLVCQQYQIKKLKV